MDTPLAELLQLARYAGRSPDLVQGAAGNVSVKDREQGLIYIKASGLRLADMTETSGFVTLSLKDRTQRGQSQARPSVEAPMHFLLGRCVLHTHAIAAGIIFCDVFGKEKAGELFKGARPYTVLYLDRYVSPGEELEQALRTLLSEQKCDPNTDTLVIFLQNHGIVVSAADARTALRTHDEVIKTITDRYPRIDPGRPAPANIILTAEQGLCGGDEEQGVFARIVHASVKKYGMLSLIDPRALSALRARDDMRYRIQVMGKDTNN